jgi:hypothetical protein
LRRAAFPQGLKPGHFVAICGAAEAAPFKAREDLDLCGDSLAINLAPFAKESQQFCPQSISMTSFFFLKCCLQDLFRGFSGV